MFALSNGHIGLRGNLDEGEPFGLPGTYLNGFYETRPLPYAEAGYGYPEDGQTVVNATNGKVIRLLVDDEPFDIRYGELLEHTRTLDLRAGDADAATVALALAERARDRGQHDAARLLRAALASPRSATRSRPIDGRAAARRRPVRAGRQRAAALAERATRAPPPRCGRRWRPRSRRSTTCGSCSSTAPSASGLRMAAGMDHVVEHVDGLVTGAEAAPDLGRVWLTAEIGARHAARRSPSSSPTAGRASARCRRCATRSTRRSSSRQAHRLGRAASPSQREYLDDFWDSADVEIEGDGELQQAVRFALFHTLQAGARAERRAIPAKGLTGPGYDGHVFWDTETFVLPVLTYTHPQAAADALLLAPRDARPRAGARPARCASRAPRSRGARSAGRSARAYWPAGHRGVPHQRRHRRRRDPLPAAPPATRSSRPAPGLELLVHTARLWRSLGHHDHAGAFHIDGVTGPDEYSAVVDDNVYTNLMAEQNLRDGGRARRAPPRPRRGALGVDEEEIAAWRDAATDMHVPFDERLQRPPAGRGLHPPRADGLRRASSTRCCCTSRTSSSTARRWSSRPTSCSRCCCAATASPPRRRRATSPTTSR